MNRGTSGSKYQVIDTGEIVNIEATVIEEESFDEIIAEGQSPFTQTRNRLFLGKHVNVKIREHIYKYDESIAKEKKYHSHEYKEVHLWLHGDGEAYKDKNGNKVKFELVSVHPSWFDTDTFHDIIILTFRSVDVVDLGNSTLPENVLVHRDGTIVTDREGNYKTDR